MPDCTGSGFKRTAASMVPLPIDPPRVGTAGGGPAANRTNFDSTAYGRKATAARADQAAAAAAAAANALSQFAHPAAPASKDAPAGWPSNRRDMDVSSMAALRAEQLKAANHSGCGGAQQQHQQSSALAAAAAEKAPSHVLVARALGPVAGRAIVTERRAFLAQIDAAEHRVRELELELQQEREKLQAQTMQAQSDQQAKIEIERMRNETQMTITAMKIRADEANAALAAAVKKDTADTAHEVTSVQQAAKQFHEQQMAERDSLDAEHDRMMNASPMGMEKSEER